jgi:hypothetical protein
VVAFGIGVAGLFLKWNHFLDFGGISINEKSETTIEAIKPK